LDSTASGQDQVEGSYESGNALSSTKGRDFLDQPSTCQLLKDCAPQRWLTMHSIYFNKTIM
jgi:hypothetical protein